MGNKKNHRVGVSEVNLVDRHLKIEFIEENKIEEAIRDIDKVLGVDAVSFEKEKLVFNIAYDASKVCLDDIEEILIRYDVEVSHDWWTSFKEEYYKFVDQNVKDNANHKPWSCHRRPPGT